MWRFVLIVLLTSAFLAGCGGGSGSAVLVEAFPPISISYPAFGPFMIGSPVNPIEPVIEGGVPTDWVVSPDFPEGVVLDPHTGVISGTPLEVQSPTPFTILAENASGQVTAVVLIYVLPAPPCDIEYGIDSIQLLLGFPTDPLIPEHGCGAAELWTILPPLPAGLTINPATGTVSGTALESSSPTEYVITAANSIGSSSALLTIEVIGTPPCDLLYSPAQISLLVAESMQPLEPQVGCGTVDEFSVSPALPAGLILDAETGVISGIAEEVSAAGNYEITATNASGTTTFSLLVRVDPQAPCDLNYSTVVVVTEVDEILEPLIPSVGCGAVANFSIEPPLPAGLELDAATGGISGVAQVVYSPIIHTVTASNVTGDDDFAILIEVVAAPCNLSYPETELVLAVGSALSDLVPAAGCGSVDGYQVSPQLPAGIELDPVNGVLSGTPTEASIPTLYEIVASNSQGQSATLLLISVIPDSPCDLQYPVVEIVLTVGEELAPLVPSIGCGVVDTFSVSTELPAGLVLDQITGAISGIASEVSAESVHVVIAANASGSSTFPLLIRVDPQAPCDLNYPIGAVSLEVDEVLSALIPTVGCGPVDNFSIDPPLPADFVLDAETGQISGIAVEIYPQNTHTVTASNVSGAVSFSLLLEVVPPPPCNLSYPQTELVLAEAVAMSDLIPSTGCGPVEVYQISPDLPAGVSLDPVTGVLSGTPTVASTATLYEIQAVNSQGASATLLVITVVPQSPCDLQYPTTEIVLSVGQEMVPQIPISGCGEVEAFSVSPDLPSGLQIDALTGVISGVAGEVAPLVVYVVVATNFSGTTTFPLLIRVDPEAPCDLNYPITVVITEVDEILEPLIPTVGCGEVDNFSINPPLPAGLELNTATGEISGVALEIYPANIHLVAASNVTGETISSILIEVIPHPPPCDFSYPDTEIVLSVGVMMSELVPTVGCGSADSFQITPDLTAGIVLDPETGVLSGTPSEASTAILYEIRASNPQGESATLLLITVVPGAPCDLQYPTTEIVLAVGEELTPLTPTTGCGEVAGFSASPALPGGIQIDSLTGVISGVANAVSGEVIHTIIATNVSGSTTFAISLRIDPQPPCNLNYPVLAVTLEMDEVLPPLIPQVSCGPVDNFSIDPLLPAGLVLDTTTGEISGVALEIHGPISHNVTASNSSGESFFSILIEVAPSAPCNLSYPATDLILAVGEAMLDMIPSTGCGEVDLFLVSPDLPAGIVLDPVSGVLAGTPSEASAATLYEIQASNPQGESSVLLLITVFPEAPCELEYPVDEIVLTVGEELPALLPSSGCGSAENFSIEPALPAGLVLDPVSGDISGVAAEIHGPIAHVITASNVSGQSSVSVTFEIVLPIPPCFLSYPETELVLTVGTPMEDLIPSTGCGDADNYQVSPALPAGLVLDVGTGVLSGTATEAIAPTLYQIQATNSEGGSSTLILITVVPQAPCDLQYPLVEVILTAGEPMAALIPTVDCGVVDVFTVFPPLPQGVNIDSSTGIISGTPQSISEQTDHMILASNFSGNTSFQISVTVLPQAPCDLSYPTDTLILDSGVDVGVIVPTVSCGTPETWQVTPPLPLGLTLDFNTGIITGVPLLPQELQTHFITTTNVSGSTGFALSIWILEVVPCDLVYPDADLILLLGEPMSTQIPSSGCGAVDLFEIDPALPAGLNFAALTGSISGTPLEVIPVTVFQVVASNEAGSVVVNLTLEIIGQGPCQISYPQTTIGHPAGVPLPAQIPTIQCGPPDTWVALPALPEGLEIDPDTGVISGSAVNESESTHVIRAENSFGSVEITLEFIIRPVFLFSGGPLEIPYSPLTGEGSGSLALRCQEGDLNPGFPTLLSGVSLAIQHDPAILSFAGSIQGSDIEALNGGTGPDFWAVNSIDGTILVGLLVSFAMSDFLVCDPQQEIVVIEFQTNSDTLQGNTMGLSGSLDWGNPSGDPPLDNLVVIDGSNSVDPIMEPVPYSLTPQ